MASRLDATCDECGRVLDRGDGLMVEVHYKLREFDEAGYRANGYVEPERFFSDHVTKKTLRFCRSIHAVKRLLDQPL